MDGFGSAVTPVDEWATSHMQSSLQPVTLAGASPTARIEPPRLEGSGRAAREPPAGCQQAAGGPHGGRGHWRGCARIGTRFAMVPTKDSAQEADRHTQTVQATQLKLV